jgi:hypothetical protein
MRLEQIGMAAGTSSQWTDVHIPSADVLGSVYPKPNRQIGVWVCKSRNNKTEVSRI